MIYTGLNRTGEIETVKAHGGADVAEVYGGINESNPIYYKTRTLTGTSPLSYKALSKPLSDYLISGNTVQNGTPSSVAPVDVVGCGVRTGNLFDGTLVVGYYNDNIGTIEPWPIYRSFRVQGLPAGQYTVSWNIPVRLVRAYYDGVLRENLGESLTSYTVTSTDGDIAFSFRDETAQTPWSDSNTVMLNSGSTALPYEPYGYKLSPTVNGTEYPIYLGQVETTRRVKKLVFKGTENWIHVQASNGLRFSTGVNDGVQSDTTVGIKSYCSHFQIVETGHTFITTNSYTITASLDFVCRIDSSYTLKTFKAFLAAQYAAGTPVTVWYVLANPTTGIVNEPLHKIGEYADTVSMAQASVTIPTIAGTNTLLVDTTVQPSEVSITGNIKEVST